MTSGERPSSISTLIDLLKSSQRPIGQTIGRSLEEIYLSGQYKLAALKGFDLNSSQEPLAVRLVINEPEAFKSYIFAFGNINRQRAQRFIESLRKDLNSVPVDMRVIRTLAPFLSDLMRRSDYQTLAAQQIGINLQTSRETDGIFFPRLFRTAEPIPGLIPESHGDRLGLFYAAGILKMVPFGRRDVHPIIIPNR